MEVVKDFIYQFHNLEGLTIGQKRHSFFKLLNTIKSFHTRTVDLLLASLSPKTQLELIFRLELLLSFRRDAELFEVLKSGDENLANKICRIPWFFQEPFADFSAHDIVDDLLPCLSFVTRRRVIICLAKYNSNEAKLDEVFDRLLEKYGMKTAKCIIQGCSCNKIEEIFQNNDVTLTSTQLVPMFNKNPHLFNIYIKAQTCSSFYEDPQIVKEIVFKEPDIYLNKEYSYPLQKCVVLGKHSTRRLLIHSREHIIEKAADFKDSLHSKTVYKRLGNNDARIFFKNIFPRDIDTFYFDSVQHFLKLFPIKDQCHIFMQTFEDVYKKSIWDCPKAISINLFQILQDTDDREKLIVALTQIKGTSEEFLEYYEVNKALGLIKDKVRVTNNLRSKENFVKKLIKTCKINNDLKNLLEVLEYFWKNHKHDHENIISRFLDALKENFNLLELREEYWNYINKLLEILKVRSIKYKENNNFVLKYVEYLWKNDQDDENKVIEIIVNEQISFRDINNLECKEFSKKLYELLISHTILQNEQKKIDDKDYDLHKEAIDLIWWICFWNKSHMDKIRLDNYPNLIHSVEPYIENVSKKQTSGYCDYLRTIFNNFLPTKQQYPFTESLKKAYFELQNSWYAKTHILLWFLKYDPELVLKFVDSFSKLVTDGYTLSKSIYSHIKKLPAIRDTVIKYCIEQIESGNKSNMSFAALAFLMNPNDYVMHISKYIPKVERIDLDDEECKKDYHVQKLIAQSFKYAKSHIVLPTLVQFCVGDYLRDALESLYYIFYHSPENRLETFINHISNKAVSVRKHAFFLITQVGSTHSATKLLQDGTSNEKNLSVKKHILNTILRYLKKNPSDKQFEMLITFIPSSLQTYDIEMLEKITLSRELPEKYRGRYFMSLLPLLRKLADENVEVGKFADKFLNDSDATTLVQVTLEFCTTFIDQYFLKSDKYFSKDHVDRFVIKYICHSTQNKTEKVEFVLKKLLSLVDNSGGDFEQKVTNMRIVNSFVLSICSDLKYLKDPELAKALYDAFLKLFSIEEFLNCYLYLHCLLLKKTSANTEELTKAIFDFKEKIVAEYGLDILKHLSSAIDFTIEDWHMDSYTICYNLWELDKNVSTTLLIMKLLPKSLPKKVEMCDNYFKILESFELHPDPGVRLNFNSALSAFKLDYNVPV